MTNKEKENLLKRIALAENTIEHIEDTLERVISYEMIVKQIKTIIHNYKQKVWTQKN